MHGRLDSKLFLHGDDWFKNVEVKKLGKKLVNEFYADSFGLPDERNCGFGNCVIENWNFFLYFEETVRERVIRLVLNFIIQLFKQILIFLAHNYCIWIFVEESTQFATPSCLFEGGD